MAITLDGVSLANASSPILFQTCRLPIMDIRRYRVPDEVVQNMNTFIGSWGANTIAPAIDSQVMDIDTVTNVADACRFPIVSVALGGCSWIAPNQKLLGVESELINWADLVTDYCTIANVSLERLGRIFNSDGTLNPGNPYTLNFVRFATAALREALGLIFTHSAMLGDASYINQFDGLYPQLDFGWENGSDACASTLNKANVVNWDTLTGGSGTGTGSPDEVTVSTSITLWGQSFTVPAGWTLADFLAAYAEAAQANYGRGGALNWEMHAPAGWRHAVLKALTCIAICGVSTIMTDAEIARYERLVSGKIAELRGHGITFPILETAYAGANTLRFGPREVEGVPTYGLIFQNIADVLQALDPVGQGLYGSGQGQLPGAPEPLLAMTRPQIANRFESLALHWDFLKVTAKCIRASLMLKAGVLATDRHLWLTITNVGTTTFRLTDVADWTTDGQAMDNVPPAVPTITAPVDDSSATDTTPTYTWSASAGADSYDIEIATDALFASVLRAATVVPATYTPTALPLDEYFVRVRARDNDGVSAWSAVVSHTITA